MTTGEGIGLEEALALMLGQLLDHTAGGRQQLVVVGIGIVAAIPLLARHLVSVLQTVGCGLVRTKDTEVVVEFHDVGGIGTKDACRLGCAPAMALLRHGNLMGMDVGQCELVAHLAAICVGVGTDAQVAWA